MFDLSVLEFRLWIDLHIMFRKFSALALLLVMTTIITLQHPVLGYCLCLDAYFTGDCNCQIVLSASETAEDHSTETTANGCCASCNSQAKLASTPSALPKALSPPCTDCIKSLILDVGCFHWDSMDHAPDASEAAKSMAMPAQIDDSPFTADFFAPTAIRGDPPPVVQCSNLPIYLRLGVLRL